MVNALVQHALNNVWCVPNPLSQAILAPNRITPLNGVMLNFNYHWSTVYLPVSTSIFHVYDLGQIDPNLINLTTASNSWQLISSVCNATNTVIDIYTVLGVQIPRTRTWFKITADKSVLIAVEKNAQLPYDFNNDQIYFRIYKNAYFQNTNLSSNQSIVVGGGIMDSVTTINQLNAQISSIVNSSYYTGGMVMYVNGYKQPSISLATVPVGSVAEFIYDSTIYKVADFQITSLTSFNSVLDNVSKVLLHYSGNSDGFIDYVDNIDIFMVDSVTQMGVYVHKNAENTLRMVTYKDYAFVANYLAPYFANFPNTSISNLYLRLHIRYSGTQNTPLLDKNQTGYLMKLTDNQILQTLTGNASTIPVWTAAALENSAYTKLMRSKYNDIKLPLVEQAYGYTEANNILGQTQIKVPAGSSYVTLPPAFQLGAMGFEYDSSGRLIGYYPIAPNTLSYVISNVTCALVEFVSGNGSNTLDEIYDYNPTVITPGNNYRYYIYTLNQKTGQDNWVDVTGNGNYTVTNGVSNWTQNFPDSVIKRMVRSDKKFLLYQTQLLAADGLLVHQLTYTQNTSLGQLSAALAVPMGELDLWLNGNSLVEGIDYIFNFPTINIISKAYLNPPNMAQNLVVRFTGFCNNLLQKTPMNEVGYVYNGALSANGRYNLHDNRVQRIVVGGALTTPDAVSFIEKTPSGNLKDGTPYSIRDVVNPMNGLLDVDPYKYYYEIKQIEEVVSGYLTNLIPQVTASPINPITAKYVLYSPFIGKIIFDLANGYISNGQLSGQYSDSLVMQLCAPYQYLLALDPILPANQPDQRYCTIHPHWLDTPIALNATNYRFIMNVVRIYGNGLINLSSLVTLNAGN